jgi:hypothetical protein
MDWEKLFYCFFEDIERTRCRCKVRLL